MDKEDIEKARLEGYKKGCQEADWWETKLEEATKIGQLQALSRIEEALEKLAKERDSDLLASSATVKKANWYNRALTDIQAIISKIREEYGTKNN